MEAFESLDVWRRGCRLAVDVHRILKDSKDYGFKDQAFRSALSVPSNVAEGYERGSRREFIRFLQIAKGSCGELRTQLYIGIEAAILDEKVAKDCVKEATELSKMLQGLIGKLQLDK
jgi:four helix bundle protein